MSETPLFPNPWHPDDEAEWSPITNSWRFVKRYTISKEAEKLMWSGKLSQLCPYCQHVEPAGAYCSNCGRQVSPDNYVKQQSIGEDGKPRRGRPSKDSIMRMVGINADA